nr:DUF3107 domain-containing protein [Antrihabitans stalactiti]
MAVEVKIGISDSPRELVVTSGQTPAEVEAVVNEAFGNGGVITLTDEKGRKYLVQSSKVSYVEIGASQGGRVGFVVSS